MAIVFISPKQRQKVFFMGITILFILLLLFISLSVFLSKPKVTPAQQAFITPKINIDFKILESEQVGYVTLMEKLEKEFTYTALTKNKEIKTGNISATSEEEARKALTEMGLTVKDIQEIKVGRENPFISYY